MTIQILSRKIYFATLYALLSLCTSCGSDKDSIQEREEIQIPYKIGYRTVSFVDSTRIYNPNSNRTDSLHFRLIEIDLWYPAEQMTSDSTLRFGYFLQSLQSRANFYSAPQRFDGLTEAVAGSFCEGFGCSKAQVLLKHPTSTFHQPKQIEKRFPLILYLASFGSMGYENYLLFESLVRQGYVIASVSSIGRYPGEMTMKNADLIEQVEDANLVLNRLKKQIGNVDTTRIGLLGYSWGGLAGALVAMRRDDINTVVSLDGSEFHHYGSTIEDQDFNVTANSPLFKNGVVSIPYLRLESNPEPRISSQDSVYNFLAKVSGTKRVIKIDSASHQDFSSLPTAVKSSGSCPLPQVYSTITELVTSHFDKYLKN